MSSARYAGVARYVYFIRPVGMDGPVKIGMSINPPKRLAEINSYSPFPLEIFVCVQADARIERQFHTMFEADHSHGEWFTWTPRMASVIERILNGEFAVADLPRARRLKPTHSRSPEEIAA